MRDFIGKTVVIDVDSPYVFAGVLEAIGEKSLTLSDADAHDLRDSNTPRERYVLDTREHGVRANRKRVDVSLSQVVSVSLLDDVIV